MYQSLSSPEPRATVVSVNKGNTTSLASWGLGLGLRAVNIKHTIASKISEFRAEVIRK